MSALQRNRNAPAPMPYRTQPLRSATELTEPLAVQQPGASLGAYETRQRTQLIVDGFANLALLSILFSGVQAQFISTTSGDNSNPAAVATNAVFFGGLMLSVSSALLSTLSGRWFSILREDDSEFLSSYWLAAETREKPLGVVEYIQIQKEAWIKKLPLHLQHSAPSPVTQRHSHDSGAIFPGSTFSSPPEQDLEAGKGSGQYGTHPTPKEKDVQFVIKLLEEEINGDTTVRERLMSKVLLSSVGLCCAAFTLFCVGIILMVWNTQPHSVALFTSVLTGLTVLLMPGFFLKHRHKRVISQLKLGRAAL